MNGYMLSHAIDLCGPRAVEVETSIVRHVDCTIQLVIAIGSEPLVVTLTFEWADTYENLLTAQQFRQEFVAHIR